MADQYKLQEKLQKAIKSVLDECDDENIYKLLTSWIVIYELKSLSDESPDAVGHFYGPKGTTSWDALGLIEWSRRFCLVPDADA